MGLRASLRRIAIVSHAEGFRTGGSFDKRTVAVLLVIGLAAAFLVPALVDDGLDFDRGLYRVAITSDSPLLPAVQAARVFRIVDAGDPHAAVGSGAADLGVTATSVTARADAKGDAALAALRQAAKDHSFSRLLLEKDQAAAFPVRVELIYDRQASTSPGARPGVPDGSGGGATDAPPRGDGTQSGSVSGGSQTGEDGGATDAPPTASGTDGGFSFIPPERSVNTPETLSPPFPFRSLLLAYAFLIPMNFVVQVYAGSAIAERLERRGEPLLASPARPWEIIVGKALPYFALMMLVSAGIVLSIGGGWLSLLAVAPIALAFLAMEFIAAMYARSFRELTFLTVFSSVLLTIYAFLPAVFADVHPIALVSPISLVVMDLRGDVVPLGQLVYALAPLTLFSGILFLLGAALYREEDLFHQKPVLAKAVDSIARQVRGLGSALKLPILLLPLVFIAELMLITLLFAWPAPVGVAGIMVAVALVEETFKAAPSYAGVRRGIIPARRAVAFGMLVGLGFFLAEKGFLLASLAGLMDVPAGAAVLGPTSEGMLGGAPWWLLPALLTGPLLLHVLTAGITGWGAKTGGRVFAVSFVLSVSIHTTYNLVVVRLFGGGMGL